MSHQNHENMPWWSWLSPLAGICLIALKFAGIISDASTPIVTVAALLLGAAVFASVHHAEVLAARIGEPLGSIVLAVAVTIIEVALIVSIMLSDVAGSDTVARDTVFAAVMVVLNGVIGLSLVLGGHRHHEQTFQLNAASSALAVLGVSATFVLVLPNFVIAGEARGFSDVQLMVVGGVVLVLYGVFLFVQTIKHRDYFMEGGAGPAADEGEISPPSAHITLLSSILLPISLMAVILLAKMLSYRLDAAVVSAGLPQAFVGVVIATVVLLPEGIASVRAAMLNRLQNSVNLVLGSALASIGMTMPVVALVSVVTGRPLTLGLVSEHTTLLLLTLFVSTLTLGTGRTTVLQGAVHLAIFTIFILLSAIP